VEVTTGKHLRYVHYGFVCILSHCRLPSAAPSVLLPQSATDLVWVFLEHSQNFEIWCQIVFSARPLCAGLNQCVTESVSMRMLTYEPTCHSILVCVMRKYGHVKGWISTILAMYLHKGRACTQNVYDNSRIFAASLPSQVFVCFAILSWSL